MMVTYPSPARRRRPAARDRRTAAVRPGPAALKGSLRGWHSKGGAGESAPAQGHGGLRLAAAAAAAGLPVRSPGAAGARRRAAATAPVDRRRASGTAVTVNLYKGLQYAAIPPVLFIMVRKD
jgi:hypothetical protein